MSESESEDSDDQSHTSENINSMTDSEIREWHESQPDKDQLWSHGFQLDDWKEDDGEDYVTIGFPRHCVTKLFTKNNWRRMGEWIRENEIGVRCVDLSGCGLHGEYAEALFGGEREMRCSLKRLGLQNNPLGRQGIGVFLGNAPSSMEYLNLDSTNLYDDGIRLLAEGLNDISIETLRLGGNHFGGGGLAQLLSATNSVRLVELWIEGNRIGTSGLSALSRFLGRDDTALKKLIMQCNIGYEDSYAKIVFDSISGKAKLEELHFWDSNKDEFVLPRIVLPSLQKLVCDTRSFQTILRSNHLIKLPGSEFSNLLMWGPPRETEMTRSTWEALEINRRSEYGASTETRMRSKLRRFYFSDCPRWEENAFDVQPFLNLDVTLMPHVLGLVTRLFEETIDGRHYFELCAGNLGSIYHLIRNCQTASLFSFASQTSATKRLEAEVESLKKQLNLLTRENDELRKRCMNLPNKRAKSRSN